MRAPNLKKIMEATSLTRAGRLHEATELLLDRKATSADKAAPAGQPSLTRQPWALRAASALSDQLFGHGQAPAPHGSTAEAGFTTHAYADEGGERSYKLFVPTTYDGRPLPLVVMLHGCTQNPDDFAAGTQMNVLAQAQNFIVAYPEQTRAANAQRCWNWFNAADQERGSGEPALIAGITRQIMADLAIDPNRVYVAGLSAGGAAAAVMGMTYPDLYAAVGVHSGLACGAATDLMSALSVMRQGGAGPKAKRQLALPTIVFHGDRDTTVNPINGDETIAQARGSRSAGKVETIHGQSVGGLDYTRTVESGTPPLEHWTIHGAGHAWSGGNAAGSYTEPRGPDASREMLRFFLANPRSLAAAA